MNDPHPRRFSLRDLALPVRLVIACFLASVGFGYCAALVQIHFAQAKDGRLLPNSQDLVRTFSGESGKSDIERLLTADEGNPFNATGTMRPAFTTKSESWRSAIRAKGKELKTKDLAKAEHALRQERDGELDSVLAWIAAGAPEAAYSQDRFVLPDNLSNQPITGDYLVSDAAGHPAQPRAVKLKSILDDRCVRCHDPEKQGEKAARFPLNSYDNLKPHVEKASTGGMPMAQLAETTHLHLLSFAMLYSLTGLVVSLSSFPIWLRCIVAPWPLVVQMLEISCWWLARLDPFYARAIGVLGALVAVGLLVQILLGFVELFIKRKPLSVGSPAREMQAVEAR
jgi:hypothetical protein